MTKWLDHTKDERIAMIQAVSGEKNIEDNAVEKDWWVTIVLKALFNTSCGSYLLFKGGTSLSKGWDLIARFSEDIDISINRDFFLDKLELECAKCENNNQLKNLRRASRDYIHGTLSDNLNNELIKLGVTGYTIENVTTTGNPPKDIDHDADLESLDRGSYGVVVCHDVLPFVLRKHLNEIPHVHEGHVEFERRLGHKSVLACYLC